MLRGIQFLQFSLLAGEPQNKTCEIKPNHTFSILESLSTNNRSWNLCAWPFWENWIPRKFPAIRYMYMSISIRANPIKPRDTIALPTHGAQYKNLSLEKAALLHTSKEKSITLLQLQTGTHYPLRMRARGQVISFVCRCLSSVVSTKIATLRDPCMWEALTPIDVSQSVK